MEGTEFLLKWNNYHTNLSSIFTRWWKHEVFVDCTLVVESKEIKCHRFVLSACSPFFETLLTNHSAHPHPLILLHEVSYDAVYSLIEFMYHGEVNVSREMLPDVVKAAGSLKIKGISDSSDIADFSKRIVMPAETAFQVPPTAHNGPVNPAQNNLSLPYSTALAVAHKFGLLTAAAAQTNNNNNASKFNYHKSSNQPLKKRRLEEPLPLSPPISVGESLNSDLQNRISPESNNNNQTIKEEHDDEASDMELQIDEGASSSSSSPRSDTPSTEIDNQDLADRLESAKSLASLATHGLSFSVPSMSRPSIHSPALLKSLSVARKQLKSESKNSQRKYTNEQLTQAVNAVIELGMTPAKAIAIYNIPRRTFFRKLSNERKLRGITSSRDNPSDSYLASPKSRSPTLENHIPLIVSNGVALKNWQATAAKTLNTLNANANHMLNKEANYTNLVAQQYLLKSFSEQSQKENECVKIEPHQGSDTVSSTNSAEKPLGEKNGFDN